MLMMLLHSLIRTKTLKDDDTYVIMTDKETKKILDTIAIFKRPNVKFIEVDSPKTMLEGMSLRYQLHRYTDVIGKTICYMDVDMLCVREMTIEIPDDVKDALLVFPEGKNDDSNYAMADSPLTIPYGASSGFFIYKCGYKVLQFMEEVYHNIRTKPEAYYTLDQPYFNKALEGKDFCNYINKNTLSFNGHNIDPADPPIFINCCGDPGSGHFHLLKMLQFFFAGLNSNL